MSSIEDALAPFDEASRAALAQVIDVARAVAPDAVDGVSYGIPALIVGGKPLLGVSVRANHLSIHPFSPAAIDAVRERLDGFSVSKGTVRFTPDRPVPDDALRDMTAARLREITG
jgi:uncharacterized protein YdhG (YjbR/CyaY superfamily)